MAKNCRRTKLYLAYCPTGDTIWKISVRYEVSLKETIRANPEISNPNLIYPGQKITVPLFSYVTSIENQVVQLTNQQRARYGFPPLTHDLQLSRVANYKSADMR
jgi:spore coat assembly protein SafA